MSDLHQMDVIVGGAGALGLAIAVELTRRGARIAIIDSEIPSASAVAAGMLAPAFEAALDPGGETFAELRAARDLWPAFAEDLGAIGLDRCGAELHAPADALGPVAAALEAAGAAFQLAGDVLTTPEDWRLEPETALAAMRAFVTARGGVIAGGRIAAATPRQVRLASGQMLAGEAVVLALGYGGLDLAPELGVLTPVKGQIVRFDGSVLPAGPILRTLQGYLVPGTAGASAGATMEAGVCDTAVDGQTIRTLRDNALVLAPHLARAPFAGRAGVRAQTPDRRCLIGRSETGVFLAAGARRNGWLLAPLIARHVADGLATGREEPPYTPGRFSRRR